MKKTKCLNPHCKNPVKSRGLCISCYVTARRLVKRGRVTWEDLVRRGKVNARIKYRSVNVEWLLEGVEEKSLNFRK